MAEIQVFTSRETFEAEVSQSLTDSVFAEENFDGFASDVQLHGNNIPLLDGCLELRANADVHSGEQLIDVPPFLRPANTSGISAPPMNGAYLLGRALSDENDIIILQLRQSEGCHHAVGFDYSGAAGYLNAPPEWAFHSITGYRITTADGSTLEAPFDVENGFLGFYDPDSSIVFVEILDIDPRSNGEDYGAEVLGIDNLILSLADTDGDGISDRFEKEHGLNHLADDAGGDPDEDGLDNLTEFRRQTNPLLADTDADGLSDGVESGTGIYRDAGDTGTNPLLADSDHDGLWDQFEDPRLSAAKGAIQPSDPNARDSDNDGKPDGYEVGAGSDPGKANSSQKGLANTLISYWKFDENYEDTADNNHGGIGAIGSFILFAPGKFGQALSIGTDDSALVIDHGNESEFDLVGSSISVSVWFRIAGFQREWHTLIAKGNDLNPAWRLGRRASGSSLNFATAAEDIGGGPAVDDGEWHHVVAVAEVGVGTRIYIDGVLTATGANALLADSNYPLFIGGEVLNDGSWGRRWGGSDGAGGIDEVAIWGRAITATEVATIWNSGEGRSIADLITPKLQIVEFEPPSDNADADADATLTWFSKIGATYAIDYSTDLRNWIELPGSFQSGGVVTTFSNIAPADGTSGKGYWQIREKN